MRTRLIIVGLAILTLGLALFGQTANTQRTPATGPVSSPDAERALIARYCLGCHSQSAKKAGLESALRITLDDLDTAHVEKNPEEWERVVRKVRAGMMPPSGMPRPDAADLRIHDRLARNRARSPCGDACAAARPASHEPHRVRQRHPRSAGAGNRSRQVSAFRRFHARLRQYRRSAFPLARAARIATFRRPAKISRMAMGESPLPPKPSIAFPRTPRRIYHIEGMPFRTRGGMKIEHEFPADGEYGFSVYPINKGNMDLNTAFGDIRGEKLELLIDGERVKLFDWDNDVARGNAVRNGTDASQGAAQSRTPHRDRHLPPDHAGARHRSEPALHAQHHRDRRPSRLQVLPAGRQGDHLRSV